MQKFDRISITEISKKDMLMIIEALEYTGKKTNNIGFLSLRDDIIKELSELSESNKDEFMNYLKNSI